MANYPSLPTPGGDAGAWGAKWNAWAAEVAARLPNVSGADNGKVLQVSGGAWSLQTQTQVTGFVISATEPVGAADGTVWIQT